MSGFTVAVIHSASTVQYSTSYLPVQPALTWSETQLIADYDELGYCSTRQTFHLKMQLENMYYNYCMCYFQINKLITFVCFCIFWGHTIHCYQLKTTLCDSMSNLCNTSCFYAETAVGEDSLIATKNNRKSCSPHMYVRRTVFKTGRD